MTSRPTRKVTAVSPARVKGWGPLERLVAHHHNNEDRGISNHDTAARYRVWPVRQASVMGAVLAESSVNSSSIVSSSSSQDDPTVTTMEKGMKPFFDMVKTFLGVVQPEKITTQTWLNLSTLFKDEQFYSEQIKDWRKGAKYLIGFAVCVAAGLLFFVVMPIVGLIFCCCRCCCGKCGGRQKKHDPKHAGCKRKSYCTVLLLLNTVALAGVVCAFVSIDVLHKKLQNENNAGPVGKLTSAIGKAESFVNNTVDEIQRTILGSYDSAKATIIDDIRKTADTAVSDVLRVLNATALLDQTKALSQDVNKTRDHLQNVATQLAFLSTAGNALRANLTRIADEVESICRKSTDSCNNFNRNYYVVNPDFSKLDNLSSQATEVSKALDMNRYIQEAEEIVANAKSTTTNSVNNEINASSSSLDSVRMEIVKGINNVRNSVLELTDWMSDASTRVQNTQEPISTYNKYGWYAGLAISGLLLLIIVLYYVGVMFGLCGERPGFGAPCCNTGTGANFLMAGVGFTFLYTWLLMLVCIILFVTGGIAYTEVCRYFNSHNPSDLQAFSNVLREATAFEKTLFDEKVNLDVAEILEKCQNNEAVYSVMKLDHMVNITQYTSLEVNKNLTAAKLDQMAINLLSLATMQNDRTNKEKLTTLSSELTDLERTLVSAMTNSTRSLNQSLGILEKQVTIKVKTQILLTGLYQSQTNFNLRKNALVTEQLRVVINDVWNKSQSAVDEILYKVQNENGRCRPLYDSFYMASDSVCVSALDPLNAFWFSLGWCLFFFVPCLIFAVKLAGLYRRETEKEYDDFDRPNFYGGMYGGNHQDTIPLTSVDRGQQAHYPGVANSAYRQDGNSRAGDKPPPYGAFPYQQDGSGEMKPPPYDPHRSWNISNTSDTSSPGAGTASNTLFTF
ncbi:hypothetical protein C0Q70_06106 [Pomacea canaliculata]|uniref:Prominin-like protein n=1 Tax=Pomacea canaliculata TaxID=400727 RepID=A0A2T7PN92_POMCA|nr:hypothetical protein C0Q70_06106 [Pomacea canaliculata]